MTTIATTSKKGIVKSIGPVTSTVVMGGNGFRTHVIHTCNNTTKTLEPGQICPDCKYEAKIPTTHHVHAFPVGYGGIEDN